MCKVFVTLRKNERQLNEDRDDDDDEYEFVAENQSYETVI